MKYTVELDIAPDADHDQETLAATLAGALADSGIPAQLDRLHPTPHTEAHRLARFTVPGEPPSKQRPRFATTGKEDAPHSHCDPKAAPTQAKKRRRARTYTPQTTVRAEERIAWNFRRAARGYRPTPGRRYHVDMTFVVGTRRRRDIDNMTKCVLDALTTVAWADDTEVACLTARKDYQRNAPRSEITIDLIDAPV